jgi:N-acetylneuraminic acid mutarotase
VPFPWMLLAGLLAATLAWSGLPPSARPPTAALASSTDGAWGTITPPPARYSHTAVWDPINAQMLVFGGYNGTSYLNDLWAYRPASNSWLQLSPATVPPPARRSHTAVWDPANAQMLVFGGEGTSPYFNDLWAYQPASNSWLQLNPTGGPPSARYNPTAVWDPANAQIARLRRVERQQPPQRPVGLSAGEQ